MRFCSVILLVMLTSCSRMDTSASIHELVSKPVAQKMNKSPFPADSLLAFSYAKLIERFGKENIVVPEESFESKRQQTRIVLYPDSDREIQLLLADSTLESDVVEVLIGRSSVWQTRAGLSTGMTLLEVENLNGKPFFFYGGGWDQGGTITNWNNGRLQDSSLKLCRLDKEFLMPYDMSKGDYDSHEFASNSKDARKGNPIVEEIRLADR